MKWPWDKDELEKKIKDLENNQKENTKKIQVVEEKQKQTETKYDQKIKVLEEKQKNLESTSNQKFKELESNQKENNKKIENLEKNQKDLETKINEKWIIGEYKWMPIGTKMPKGWVKVNIPAGYTIVQGSTEGKTEGSVKKHQHFFNKKRQNSFTAPQGTTAVVSGPGTASTGKYVWFSSSKDINAINTTDNEGPGIAEAGVEGNLAAGINAELWQYKG